jgi:hypothetical protein
MIPHYVNIKDSTTLVRDTQSMGVLDTNQGAFQTAMQRHRIALQKLAEERRKERELNSLRKEVDELKQLVRQVLEKV